MSDYRDDFRNAEREAGWTLGRAVKWILIGGLTPMAIGAIFGAINWGLGLASQPARIVTKTLDADNVLYNYEWFKRQWQSIVAIDRMIGQAQESLNEMVRDAAGKPSTYQGDVAVAEQRRIVQGLRNQRLNYIAEYNARAKMANRNIFMGHDLPPEIQP